MFDVGLLNHMLGTTYQQIKQQAHEYKGFIAENFVQKELAVMGVEPTYAWTASNAEIEFLLTDNLGHIVPVEVKSGTRTRAKSLASYINRYQPTKAVKLSALTTETRAAPGQSHHTNPTTTTALHLPLYDVAFLPGLLGMALQGRKCP